MQTGRDHTSGDTLILTEDDLCTNSSSEKECHVYIERLNLSKKCALKLRAANHPVRAPEACNQDSSRCWSNLATYQIKVTGTGQLCVTPQVRHSARKSNPINLSSQQTHLGESALCPNQTKLGIPFPITTL